MIDREHDLPITKQAEILKVSRGSVYYLPRPISSPDLDHATSRSAVPGVSLRRFTYVASPAGFAGMQGRRHVKTFMRRMGIEALVTTAPRIKPTSLRSSSAPRGGLTPAEVPLIDAEFLFRQPGPVQSSHH